MGEEPSEEPAVADIPIASPGAASEPLPAFASAHAAVLAVESAPVLDSVPRPKREPEQPPETRRSRVRRQRVLIGDTRRNGRYLRATWHAEGRMFVLSTWTDELCTGAVRIPVQKAPELINLLSDGLGDALDPRPVEPRQPSPMASAQVQVLGMKARFLRWMRTGSAQLTTALRAREVSTLAKVQEHRRRSGQPTADD